eukprot:365647-Chlamydomonas_euryale.AAC.21
MYVYIHCLVRRPWPTGATHLHVHVCALVKRVHRVHLHRLPRRVVAALAHKVVARKELLARGLVGQRVLAHGARLGVVVCGVEVEVEQVLGGVLADAQVAHRARRAAARRAHALLDLAEPCQAREWERKKGKGGREGDMVAPMPRALRAISRSPRVSRLAPCQSLISSL